MIVRGQPVRVLLTCGVCSDAMPCACVYACCAVPLPLLLQEEESDSDDDTDDSSIDDSEEEETE
jgi:hypothetical protein